MLSNILNWILFYVFRKYRNLTNDEIEFLKKSNFINKSLINEIVEFNLNKNKQLQ